MLIGICDDDKLFRDHLKQMVEAYFLKNDKEDVSFCFFESGEALLASEQTPDILFLDVVLGTQNGIMAGAVLKERNPGLITFITTSYSEYLDDAFHIQAFRFLTKPIDPNRLYRGLDDVFLFWNNKKVTFYEVGTGEAVVLPLRDIVCVEIMRRKVRLTGTQGFYYTREPFNWWKEKLNAFTFIQPHASYIVNMDYMSGFSRRKITLEYTAGGKPCTLTVPISSRREATVKQQIFYIMERK